MSSRFVLPDAVGPDRLVYLDGNSLGPVPVGVAERLQSVIATEWGTGLIRSWNDADWIGLARRVGDRIAPLIGAGPGEVIVGDSTSVSLFKTMVAALRLRPDRRVIVVEESTFPTDGYVAAGVAELTGAEVRWCDPADPVAAVDDEVALLSLTHVDFRTGAMFDLDRVTAAAQRRGALVQWDLCHSTGAIPVDISSADLAVGCGYKYLNGGPGAPAFTWVHPDLIDRIRQPITGWMGHATPFAMARAFAPAEGIGRLSSGTPPILALNALDAALDAFDGVRMSDLRATSLDLTDSFIAGLDDLGLAVATPRDHGARGSQVSFRHPHAYGIVQALIARQVIGDFRDPDIARFGFAPLYNTPADVTAALERLRLVLASEEFLDPAYASRNAVT